MSRKKSSRIIASALAQNKRQAKQATKSRPSLPASPSEESEAQAALTKKEDDVQISGKSGRHLNNVDWA